MPLLVIAGLALWFWFGDPASYFADLFYEDDAAPWETVDAFYYPNRGDFSVSKALRGLPSVDACRSAVKGMASDAKDAEMARGEYECGVGKLKGNHHGLIVYRLTVR